MLSRSICAAAFAIISFFFKAKKHPTVWMNHILKSIQQDLGFHTEQAVC